MEKVERCACGEPKHLLTNKILTRYFYIHCSKCGIGSGDYPTAPEAVTAWNAKLKKLKSKLNT
jgi:hypothetical protein